MTRIAHLADIHIRQDRREEYAAVFHDLYAQLRICLDAQSLIVVAGDVFHHKDKASAWEFLDVFEFLRNLSEIAPVVLIGGNHDMITKHPGSMDLLSAVLQNAKLKNVEYLRHSQFRYLHGIVWAVLATDTKGPIHLTPADRDAWLQTQTKEVQDAPAICLFHEEVKTAKTCQGFKFMSGRLEPTRDFAGYEAAMGGHIHRRQIHSRWAYPGSLFQQAIDEGHTNHGFLIWDFNFRVPRMTQRPFFPIPECHGVDVPNSRDAVCLRFCKGKDITANRDRMPKQPQRCEVTYDEASTSVMTSLLNEYHFEKGTTIRYTLSGKKHEEGSEEKEATSDASNLSYETRDFELQSRHRELIEECLGKNHKFLPAVLKLHEDRFFKSAAMKKAMVRAQGGRVRLKKFWFSNMFAFGGSDDAARTGEKESQAEADAEAKRKVNVIDFDPLEGKISGIIAANASGKSLLLRALVFALYDKLTVKKPEVLRRGAKFWWLRLEFEIDGKPGVICKSGGTRPATTCVSTGMHAHIGSVLEGNCKEQTAILTATEGTERSDCSFEFEGKNLTKGTMRETIKKIESVVGVGDDACLSAFSLQGDIRDFVKMKPVKRRQTVAKFLDLGSFKKLEDEIKEEIKAQKNTLLTKKKDFENLNRCLENGQLPAAEKEMTDLLRQMKDLECLISAAKVPIEKANQDLGGLRREEAHHASLQREVQNLVTSLEFLKTFAVQWSNNLFCLSVPSVEVVVRFRADLGRELGKWVELDYQLDKSANEKLDCHEQSRAELVLVDDVPMLIELEQEFQRLYDTEAIEKIRQARVCQVVRLKWLQEEHQRKEEEEKKWRASAEHRGQVLIRTRARLEERIAAESQQLDEFEARIIDDHHRKVSSLNQQKTDCLDKVAEGRAHGMDCKSGSRKLLEGMQGKDLLRSLLKEGEVLEFGECLTMAVGRKSEEIRRKMEKAARPAYSSSPLANQLIKIFNTREEATAESCQTCQQVQELVGQTAVSGEDDESIVMSGHEQLRAIDRALRTFASEEEKILLQGKQEAIKAGREASQRRQNEWRAEQRAEEEKAVTLERKTLSEFRQQFDDLKRERETVEKAMVLRTEDNRAGQQVDDAKTALRQSVRRGLDRLRAAMQTVEHKLEPRCVECWQKFEELSVLGACEKRVEDLKRQLEKLEGEHKKVSVKWQQVNDERVRLEEKSEQAKILTAQIEELKMKHGEWHAYLTVLNPGGLGDRLVQASLRGIEDDANEILAKMNARFEVEIDPQCELRVLDLDKGPELGPLGSASGFQLFALQLTFRLVFWRKSRVAVPDCFVTDEGFGTADPRSLEGLASFLEILATDPGCPRLLMIITHSPEMKNQIEYPLSITKTDDGNHISNCPRSSSGVAEKKTLDEAPVFRERRKREMVTTQSEYHVHPTDASKYICNVGCKKHFTSVDQHLASEGHRKKRQQKIDREQRTKAKMTTNGLKRKKS